MIFTEKTLKTLEFDKICGLLADCAMTEGSKEMASLLSPSDDIEVVLSRQRRTTDARRLMDIKGTPPFGGVIDVSGICERADKGAILSARELLDAANLLRTSRLLTDYIRTNKHFDTVLDVIFERLINDQALENEISRAIISDDMIADEASPALGDIRRKIREANNRIKETLQHYISGGSYSKYLQENIVTTRDGRYVIPVKVEYKNEVKGMIHDTSASGATVFVEPMAVVDANNELRVLEAKEQREIDRILAALSAKVSGISGSLVLDYRNITELAFVFACGRLSEIMDGVSPQIVADRSVNLKGARHPLISKEKVVPINVAIGEENGYDTLIITGPNTGGKTVTLKTLGLLSLMVQAGLHIPVDPRSSVCVFDSILVDIGDEQSIEQSLSTFSSHMVNIVSMIDKIGERSLVLFDELGVGTDPVEGAALAVAIIESVREKGAMCAATTHYAELKAYALDTAGVRNASCEFDVNTLRPTYKLIIGAPGKSNAFAISEKLGLPKEIIKRAEDHVSADNKKFEDVIGQLEKSRLEMEKEKEKAENLRTEYEKFKAESEKRIKAQIAESDKILDSARGRAEAMISSAKASSEYIFDQMDKVRRAKDSERLAEELDAAKKAVKSHIKAHEDEYNPVEDAIEGEYVLPRPLRKGDEVILADIGTKGVLTSDPDKNGNVSVTAGIIRTKTNISNLRLVENSPTVITKETGKKKASDFHATLSRNCKDEIDLRGMTGEEAWLAVDKYLDDVVIAGFNTVRLIHGKGTGALRNAIWQYLKGDGRISSYRIGRYGEGDGGVTVVEMKNK